MTRSIFRSVLEFLALGFAPPIKPATRTSRGFDGQWNGRANLPSSMLLTGIELRMNVRDNARTSCVARVEWSDRSVSRVRGRGFVYASGRCSKWDDDPGKPRVVVHTIARLSGAAVQVTFDLFLPDGSELFGYATLRGRSLVSNSAF